MDNQQTCPECGHPAGIHTTMHGCTNFGPTFMPCMCELNTTEIENIEMREALTERDALIASLEKEIANRDELIKTYEDIIGSGKIMEASDGDLLVTSVEDSTRYYTVEKLIEKYKKAHQ